MSRIAAFLLGAAVGWLLVQRRRVRKPTTAYNVVTVPMQVGSYRSAQGVTHIAWMQADGTWTWT